MITGDFITDRPNDEQLDALKNCLAKISKKVPTFASLGNHDGGTWAAARSGFSSPGKDKKCFLKQLRSEFSTTKEQIPTSMAYLLL